MLSTPYYRARSSWIAPSALGDASTSVAPNDGNRALDASSHLHVVIGLAHNNRVLTADGRQKVFVGVVTCKDNGLDLRMLRYDLMDKSARITECERHIDNDSSIRDYRPETFYSGGDVDKTSKRR
jgi:hypothetical protein